MTLKLHNSIPKDPYTKQLCPFIAAINMSHLEITNSLQERSKSKTTFYLGKYLSSNFKSHLDKGPEPLDLFAGLCVVPVDRVPLPILHVDLLCCDHM